MQRRSGTQNPARWRRVSRRARFGRRRNGAFTTGRQAGPEGDAGRSRAAGARLLRAPPGSGRSRPAGQLRHQRASRLVVARRRSPRRTSLAITQAICDYRRGAGHRRPALHGQGHARAVGAGAAHRARSAGRERRRDASSSATTASRRRRSSRARSSSTTAAAADASRRRDRGHAVAQSAGGRRLQVQPAERRPRGHRRHARGSRTGPTSCCAAK